MCKKKCTNPTKDNKTKQQEKKRKLKVVECAYYTVDNKPPFDVWQSYTDGFE